MQPKPELTGEEKALLYQMANSRRRELLWHDISLIAPTMGMTIYGLVSDNFTIGLIGVGIYIVIRIRLTTLQERAALVLGLGIQKLLNRYESQDETHA